MKKFIGTLFTALLVSTTAFADRWVCEVHNEVGGSDDSYNSHLLPTTTIPKLSLEEAIGEVAKVINAGSPIHDVCGFSDPKFFDSIKTASQYAWIRNFHVGDNRKTIGSKITPIEYEDFFEFVGQSIERFNHLKATTNPEKPAYAAACHFECRLLDTAL